MQKITNDLRNKLVAGVAMAGMAAGLVALPGQARAQAADEARQGGLAEIVVTAQRREENLQQVPIAINAVTSDTLRNLGVEDTQTLVQAVPSLNFTRSGPSGIFIIRGVSTPNGAAGEEGSTAVYVDDIYMPDLAQTINKFNNIERIEVLNGPQGTLFGRNATGGAIRVITRDPGDYTEFDGQVGIGNYDVFTGQAYLSAPLGDKIGWNIAFSGQEQGKGFGNNPTLGRRVKTEDYWGLRSKLVAKPTDNLKVTLTGEYFETENDYALYIYPVSDPVNDLSQDSPAGYPSGTDIRVWGVSGKLELDVGFGTLTSITAYRDLRNKSSFDIDGGALDLLHLDYVAGTETFQQEVRLSSESTEPLSWQVGAFYMHSVAHQDQTQGGIIAPLAAGNPLATTIHIVSRGPVDSISVFGEATYAITPTTHLTGGVRWTQDKRKLPVGRTDAVDAMGNVLSSRTNPLDSVTYDEFTYRVALRQDISDDVNVYASVNRGFKSGQFNLQSPFDEPVKPETIMAYEVGMKGDFLDNHLRVNLSAFHYDIDDYQVRASPGGVSALRNAAKVKIDGVDAHIEAAVTDQFLLVAGASYLDAKYDSFPDATTGDATGNRTAIAPKFTFSTSGTYTIPFENGSELRLTGAYTHKSKYYFEPNNVLTQPAYGLFNASAEYSVNENVSFEVWMKNIGNKLYAVQKVSSIGQAALAGEPRTYGLNAKFHF
ncbi:MAG: TonB-dependent receptor [Novosphingobium sp.]|nr:TonB-dependent receptor [Novosphingobium sp.]MCP5404017.1 TonB-dependent receptor [Novosphingobium sp.]